MVGRSAGSTSRLVLDADGAGHQRAGDHGAEAAHREHAVHRQPRGAVGVARRRRGAPGPTSTVRSCVEPVAGRGRHRHHRRALEERSGDELADVERRQRDCLGVGGVDLGQRDGAAPDAAAGGRCRSARGSAASRLRRRRRPAARRRCRRRRPAWCGRSARGRGRRRTTPSRRHRGRRGRSRARW